MHSCVLLLCSVISPIVLQLALLCYVISPVVLCDYSYFDLSLVLVCSVVSPNVFFYLVLLCSVFNSVCSVNNHIVFCI